MTDRRPSIDRRPRGSIAAVAGAIKASSPKGGPVVVVALAA